MHVAEPIKILKWNDVLGILQVQTGRLDHDYLFKGAKKKGVFELLEKALKEISDINE